MRWLPCCDVVSVHTTHVALTTPSTCHTWSCLITHGTIRSCEVETTELWWMQTSLSPPPLHTPHTVYLLNISYCLYLSTHLLSATISVFMLSLSLALSLAPSLSFSLDCLWSVPSEYQCAAVSLETERAPGGGGGAGYSQGVFMLLAPFPKTSSSLVRRPCAHMRGTCSKACYRSP